MRLYEQPYERAYHVARTDPRREIMVGQEFDRLLEHFIHRAIEDGRTFHISRVLDIGCGTGEFLAKFPNAQRYGIETSEYAKDICRRQGVLFELPKSDRWADLVIMRGVLQHFPNPRTMLWDAHRYLKPGGVLAVLATPNKASLMYRRTGTLPCLVPELNYWIPTPDSLARVLVDVGFRELRFTFPYRGTPYARPWRDGLSFLLGRPAAFPRSMMECYARA